MAFIPLLILWGGWCALHSLLIHPPLIRLIENRLEPVLLSRFPWLRGGYRLVFNLVALGSLALVFWLSHRLPVAADAEPVFAWSGRLGNFVRFLLLALALLLFWAGARAYDMASFIGLRQLRTGSRSLVLASDDGFAVSGVLGLTRHPWYLGSLLFLWTARGGYSEAELAVCLLLSVYLVVGSWLEERKILAVYGESYRAYQRRVSMLVPFRWLLLRAACLFRKSEGDDSCRKSVAKATKER